MIVHYLQRTLLQQGRTGTRYSDILKGCRLIYPLTYGTNCLDGERFNILVIFLNISRPFCVKTGLGHKARIASPAQEIPVEFRKVWNHSLHWWIYFKHYSKLATLPYFSFNYIWCPSFIFYQILKGFFKQLCYSMKRNSCFFFKIFT